MRFTIADYESLHGLCFRDDYLGYKPEVQESPNGDGTWDTEKRYAHVAPKYLRGGPVKGMLWTYFNMAHIEACSVHDALGFPRHLKPEYDECCLRVLDYPIGASSAEHTDFDLFTLQLYRDPVSSCVRTSGIRLDDNDISRGIHFGEMAEVAGLRPAMPHKVLPSQERQRSIVFFALPARGAALITAGDWLDERYVRSRR